MDELELPKSGSFTIIVKAGQRKSEVVSYDSGREAFRVNIKEKAENNKANVEIVKFFKRQIKKDVKIVKGITSKEKVIRIVE